MVEGLPYLEPGECSQVPAVDLCVGSLHSQVLVLRDSRISVGAHCGQVGGTAVGLTHWPSCTLLQRWAPGLLLSVGFLTWRLGPSLPAFFALKYVSDWKECSWSR